LTIKGELSNIKWFIDKIFPYDKKSFKSLKDNGNLENLKSLLERLPDEKYVKKRIKKLKLLEEKNENQIKNNGKNICKKTKKQTNKIKKKKRC